MKTKRQGALGLWVMGILVASVFVLWPLLRKGFYVSDDGEWMVIRLSAFYQSLSSGQFPVRYLGRLNHNFGYPVANFLYPGFLYLGSVLHLMRLSFVDAVKCIMATSVVGSAIVLFFALRRRFTSAESFAGVLNFLYAPYLLYDLYRRGSVGEILSFFPASMLVFAYFWDVNWLIPPAVAFLLVSHNTSAFIFGLAFFVIFLTKKHPLRLIWHVLLGFGMAAFFWGPAIFEQKIVQFGTVTVSDPTQYFVSVSRAALLGMPTLLGIVLWFRSQRRKTAVDTAMVLSMLAGLVLATGISTPFWQIPQLFRWVQFPYRFLMLSVVFGPWMVAWMYKQYSGWKRVALSFIIIGLWLFPIVESERAIQFVEREVGYYATNEGTTTVSNEYMPLWVHQIPQTRMSDELDVVSGNVNLSARRFFKDIVSTTVIAQTPGVVQINKVYYPGWGITIDGIPAPIQYDNPFGFMQVSVATGRHTLRAAFRETPMRFIIDCVSLVSAVSYLVYIRRLSR